jgi:hypothetical protein
MDERILGKIKKCLALSKSSNANEAATAMRQAQKLMEAHGVTSLDLQISDVGEAEVKSAVSVSVVRQWELYLVKTIAKAFGCQVMWKASISHAADNYARFVLIGLKQQVEIAVYVCVVMQRRLVKSRREFISPFSKRGTTSKKDLTTIADSFCIGWVHEVEKTVMEFALGEDAKTAIQSYIDKKGTNGKAKTRDQSISREAMARGQEAGKNVTLHRPVGAEFNLAIEHSE